MPAVPRRAAPPRRKPQKTPSIPTPSSEKSEGAVVPSPEADLKVPHVLSDTNAVHESPEQFTTVGTSADSISSEKAAAGDVQQEIGEVGRSAEPSGHEDLKANEPDVFSEEAGEAVHEEEVEKQNPTVQQSPSAETREESPAVRVSPKQSFDLGSGGDALSAQEVAEGDREPEINAYDTQSGEGQSEETQLDNADSVEKKVVITSTDHPTGEQSVHLEHPQAVETNDGRDAVPTLEAEAAKGPVVNKAVEPIQTTTEDGEESEAELAARKKRVAERMAKMGAVNPLAGGVPWIRRPSQMEEISPDAEATQPEASVGTAPSQTSPKEDKAGAIHSSEPATSTAEEAEGHTLPIVAEATRAVREGDNDTSENGEY